MVQSAIRSPTGTADLHLKAAHVQASLVAEWRGGADIGVLRVSVTTLDREIAKYGRPAPARSMLKGFEAEVLKVEPPPNEWTPVVGSKGQEVSDGSQSTSVVHG
jgi:hypothetical protein